MTRAFTEILILVINALSADTLAYIAGVIQKVMNHMDEAAFQNLTKQLHKSMHRSLYMIITAELPKIAFIPYFIIFGFTNWWFTAGAVVAVAASLFVSKPLILPTYKKIYDSLESSDVSGLREWRRKLQARNRFRAVLQFVSVILMIIGLYGVS
ncbi:hypothetical protein Ana3638_11355 [Anaerocolumna sedimenticola]|uniref:DUF1772 domain-containing protein n=1 Tax=Anaerocolumna sedimenticola TaxID=2696063 RepID=A0A6P1TPI4_9FIRM|nr:hypothetical protein [Anaerocolumna sedimenticola]QHQ61298.1 hypothetical protein Ana3638_11355 [Anaerocolumna sedimenticola]